MKKIFFIFEYPISILLIIGIFYLVDQRLADKLLLTSFSFFIIIISSLFYKYSNLSKILNPIAKTIFIICMTLISLIINPILLGIALLILTFFTRKK